MNFLSDVVCMRKIRDVDVKGKKIIVRVDLNSPVENGKITGSARINAHAVTIKELSQRGARVIVLSHQGREGHDDFIGLEQHARLLHHKVGHDVFFIENVVGAEAEKAIKQMKDGDILVLDNVRFLPCETTHKDGLGEIVHHLSPIVDYYVLDALSVAHRKHSSVVGFSHTMPCFAGDVLAAEVEALEQVKKCQDVTFIFGGSKVEDSFSVMKKWLDENRARKILLGGALSIIFLSADGKNIGDSKDYIKNAGLEHFIPQAKALLDTHRDKIMLPVDVGLSIDMKRVNCETSAVSKGQIWDIGPQTVSLYVEAIDNSKCVVMNGPLGVYELEDFGKGTQFILDSIARSDSFSLLGGGHTITALERFGIDKKYFGYVSLSGKALIEYLCGKPLPGLVVLEENEKKFKIKP